MKMNTAIRTTRTALALAFCLAGATFGVIGCQNTAEGAKEDAAKDTAAVGNAAEKTADATKDAADKAAMATKEGAENAGDALTMTPKVKNAIVSNATLNDPKNLINVDTKDGKVHLKGHVLSNDQKKLAGDIAAKTVKESGSSDTVLNELTVENH
jgi:osmotically-inducible protein OsmY